MKVAVVGYGCVGKAVANLLRVACPRLRVETFDVDSPRRNTKFAVMHVCYPFSVNFVNDTVTYMRQFKPNLTLIESTVLPGTTTEVHERTYAGLCHSPVRGRHDTLQEDLKVFTKFIGPCTEVAGKHAKSYYEGLGLKTYVASGPFETEVAKLMNLTYFASQIGLFQEFERVSSKYSLNFEDVTRFFETNTEESNGKYPRPVLRGGCIEGTCVMPAVSMLRGDLSNSFVSWIQKSNDLRRRELCGVKRCFTSS